MDWLFPPLPKVLCRCSTSSVCAWRNTQSKSVQTCLISQIEREKMPVDPRARGLEWSWNEHPAPVPGDSILSLTTTGSSGHIFNSFKSRRPRWTWR